MSRLLVIGCGALPAVISKICRKILTEIMIIAVPSSKWWLEAKLKAKQAQSTTAALDADMIALIVTNQKLLERSFTISRFNHYGWFETGVH